MFEFTLMICLAIIAFSPMLPAEPPTKKGDIRRARHRGHHRLPACSPVHHEGPTPTFRGPDRRLLLSHVCSTDTPVYQIAVTRYP